MHTNKCINFIEHKVPDVKIDTKVGDPFYDYSGYVMFQGNNGNSYFWGKAPTGGGPLVVGSRETIEFQGERQIALRMIWATTFALNVTITVNCTAKSAQVLCAGIVDMKSKKYSHFGEQAVNGLTTAVFRRKCAFEQGQDFFVVIWQQNFGDPIEVFDSNHPSWQNKVSFDF
jgi:hypothetical protein